MEGGSHFCILHKYKLKWLHFGNSPVDCWLVIADKFPSIYLSVLLLSKAICKHVAGEEKGINCILHLLR